MNFVNKSSLHKRHPIGPHRPQQNIRHCRGHHSWENCHCHGHHSRENRLCHGHHSRKNRHCHDHHSRENRHCHGHHSRKSRRYPSRWAFHH